MCSLILGVRVIFSSFQFIASFEVVNSILVLWIPKF